METSGSSSGSSRADPGIHTPDRPSGGEGGAVRREGRDRIEAIRNPDSHDPDGLRGEVGVGSGGYEGGGGSCHQPLEAARAIGPGGVKLEGGSESLQAVTSG
jgi:hypothetical protein